MPHRFDSASRFLQSYYAPATERDYDHANAAEHNAHERCLVRANHVRGDHVCRTNDPDTAVWIAQRLNAAHSYDELVKKISDCPTQSEVSQLLYELKKIHSRVR